MGDEEDEGNIVGKEYPGGRVGLNCRVIKEEEKVVVEEINHGFINDGYDDYLYEDSGTTIYDELFSREILGKTQAAYFYEYLIFSADSPFSTEIFQNYPFNHNNFF